MVVIHPSDDRSTASGGPPSPAARTQTPYGVEGDTEPYSFEEDLSEYGEDEITTLLASAIDIIDRLYRLATKIRNPATRLASSKAATFKNVNPETGVDLMVRFVEIDHRHIEELFWEYRAVDIKEPEQVNEERRDQEHRPRSLGEEEHKLISRLAKANTYRRQQFGYWSRHRAKNARETAKALEAVDDVAIKKASQLKSLPGIGAMTVAPSSSKVLSRPSTATWLQNPAAISLDDTTSVMSTRSVAPQARSVHDEQVEIPEPPASLRDAKHFSCPYCFTFCSKSLLERKPWR